MEAPGRERDGVLIAQFQAGRESAFDELVKRHMEKAVQLARTVCGNYEDAKDISQEAFVKAYHALKNFKGEAQFSTWFYRILMNSAKDYLRKKKRLRLADWDDAQSKDHFLESVASPEPGPAGSALLSEFERQVTAAIEKLPFQQQWIFILRFLEGFSLKEIAQATGLAEGTVKAALHFGMKKFKAEISAISGKG
ncbi:MAG TPA: sigma-70 family RNA polymerase sigma factor [Verrucomicrobiae bacterium]|nr:sigma-70 family RNA polymerase sigma factor [Verrucomicrobiae bacterium]